MKKLLILLFIFSIGCFGQLTRKPAGLVGLKDTTDGVKTDVGIIDVFLNSSVHIGEEMYFGAYDQYMHPVDLSTGSYVLNGFESNGDATACRISMFTYCDDIATTLSASPEVNNTPIISIGVADTNTGIVYYQSTISADSSLAFYNALNTYGLYIRPSGQMQSITANGTENVLTDYGTLSGTIYVKDTNNVIKSLTFTNGLLTGSDFSEFAGVFKVNDSNLTQTNFKQSPDYAEFLEFQKYLYMKKSLAQKE